MTTSNPFSSRCSAHFSQQPHQGVLWTFIVCACAGAGAKNRVQPAKTAPANARLAKADAKTFGIEDLLYLNVPASTHLIPIPAAQMFSLANATKSMDCAVLDFSPDYQALFAVAPVARCALDLDDSQKVSTPPHAMSRVVTLCRRSFMTQGTVKFYNDQKGFGWKTDIYKPSMYEEWMKQWNKNDHDRIQREIKKFISTKNYRMVNPKYL